MKIAQIPELKIWVVADYQDGEDQLPHLEVFSTREEAREYTKGNKPSLLSKFKLYFERLER